MIVTREQLDQIVEHARADAPNECCGVVAARDGEATAVHRATNAAASPFRFEVEPKELLALISDIEDRGEELAAIYHSHTRSEPYPSQTDLNFAAQWPGVEWIIVGVPRGGAGEAEVRTYRIEGGTVAEAPLDVR